MRNEEVSYAAQRGIGRHTGRIFFCRVADWPTHIGSECVSNDAERKRGMVKDEGKEIGAILSGDQPLDGAMKHGLQVRGNRGRERAWEPGGEESPRGL